MHNSMIGSFPGCLCGDVRTAIQGQTVPSIDDPVVFFPAHGAPTSSSAVPNLTAPATTPEQVHLPSVDFDEDTNPGQRPLDATANDIGHAVGRSLTAEDRAIFVTPWIPTADSDYPTSTHIKSGIQRIRRLLPHHLTDFPWLAMSRVDNKTGAFCVPCVLFSGKVWCWRTSTWPRTYTRHLKLPLHGTL